MNLQALHSSRIEPSPPQNFSDFAVETFKQNQYSPQNGDIIVISSKVLSYFHNGVVNLSDITPKKKAIDISDLYNSSPELIQLVLDEADKLVAIRPWVLLTIKNGIYCANAGVDTSNVPKGYAVCWPKELQKISDEFYRFIKSSWSVDVLGVMIIDSVCIPARKGTIAVCLAATGVDSYQELKGKEDLFGNILQYSALNIYDSIATTANCIMGESDEANPFVVVSGVPDHFLKKINETTQGKKIEEKSILIKPEEDMFPISS